MKVKYLLTFTGAPSIIRIEVERETASYVWIDGKRKSKNYIHDTFADAKLDLMLICDLSVRAAQAELDREKHYKQLVNNLNEKDCK